MGQLTEALKLELLKRGLKYVGTRGNTKAPIAFIGEAPGADEDAQGFPFLGPSGQELDREIAEAGILQGDSWFGNPYSTRPPDNKLSRLPELGIEPTVYEAAFWERLAECRPTLIVACGKTPTNLLCPETIIKRKDKDEEGISFSHWRGSLLTSPFLNWPHYVIPLYHPAFILRDYTERDTNVFILRRVAEEFAFLRANGRIQPLPERELLVEPNATEAISFLREILNAKLLTSIDIELLSRRVPYTIALSNSRNRAMSIGFWDYNISDTERIFRLLAAILLRVPQVGQNYTTFDANWLRALGLGPNIRLVDDTLFRHHVLWPELSHKLEFQVMQYTREPFFKEEGKGWRFGEGKKKLMRYNCKDACTTLEIYEEQENEFNDNPKLHQFYTDYEMPLARAYYDIDRRGLAVDLGAKATVSNYIKKELQKVSQEVIQLTGKRIFVDLRSMEDQGIQRLPTDVLLSSSQDVLKLLKDCGLKPKNKVTWKGGQASSSETTNEESLNELFAETNHPVLNHILRVRELTKINGTYVNQRLYRNVSYTSYNVAGTLGGRRSARKNVWGYGSNHQNQPKHSDLGKLYRAMLVARPGKILVFCDQVQAEDWIVNAIITDVSGARTGLDELLAGVDRHSRLASFLLGMPLDRCGKGTHERFIGKKVRHAGNYEMGHNRMASALAKEGFSVPAAMCQALLEKFHASSPEIRGVFHKWVEDCLRKHRMLRSPLGRERTFFGLHPYRDNSKLFKEAYSYVPQTTVGDNTGLAVYYCERQCPGLVVHECHDSIGLEVNFEFEEVLKAMQLLERAFDRVIKFPNGLELRIPIEFELGFDFGSVIGCESSNRDGLNRIWPTLAQLAKARTPIITGVPPQPLPVC